MASQTYVFVVLPNGITTEKELRLSIYLTPRLTQGATLAAFPDILGWPASIQTGGLEFEFACAGKKITVPADRTVLRPDVWSEIFTPSTFVERYTIPDFDKRVIVSYPVRDAMAYFKYAYQAAGSGRAASQGQRGGLRTLLRDLIFRKGSASTLDAELAQMRVALWNEQHSGSETVGGAVAGTVAELHAPVPPDGVPTVLNTPSNAHDVATRFALFHHMPPAPNRPALPQDETDFAKTLDFHRALTTLNSYPALMRALGLVFDVELPSSFCANSPAGGTYQTIALTKIIPGFGWKLTPHFSLPVTSYARDNNSFRTAPATAATTPAGDAFVPGDVVGGFLALSPNSFNLLQVDLDGGLLKALALADNAENARNQSVVGDSLPALRSSGIALIANGRGMQLLQSIAENKAFDEALNANAPLPRPLNARDVLRGFRIDVWVSRTQQWYSLHRRNSHYRFGSDLSIEVDLNDEEGFQQPTAMQPADDPTRKPDPTATTAGIPQPATDLYVHERIARWEGWSLSAQRPGLALNRSADPAMATTPDPTLNRPMTPFKMVATFAAVARSLPELRFGLKYRLRARAVDLAGNSIPLNSPIAAELAAPANGALLPYLRFEPISPPLLILQEPTQGGGTLERLVIRSFNAGEASDRIVTTDADHRHVAPPRVSEHVAEQHGMFDDAHGTISGSQSTYDTIVARDTYEIPQESGVPIEPAPSLAVEYFPDPFARGAALRNLPNAPDDTGGRLVNDALEYAVLPDVQARAGSVTYIDFGTQWPQRTSFLLTLVEGSASPEWDSANRELTLSMQKGAVVEVELSSYLFEGDLAQMGVWGWLRELFAAAELNAMQGGSAAYQLGITSDVIALLTRLILEGGHDMITPARTLTLVHAVQQPLAHPEFVQLPVVHQAADPILASALRNSFTPITAWRSRGSHSVVLLGALKIDGQTTSKIDLEARWLEYSDDPSQPAPTRTWNTHAVETIPLATVAPGPIYSDASATRMVGVYVPPVDTLWFCAPIDELAGVETPPAVAAPLHRFDDTKHRWVRYTAIATTRFEEYFPPGLDFTRTGEPLMVDVPASARPTAPDIAYVVPTFGWERQESSNVKSSVRFGNGLRVYLNRPWYSSGEGELLGVVLWNGAVPAPDYATREQFKSWFTQWGNDPIWNTGAINEVPGTGDFPGAATSAAQLLLEETAQPFDVAGHHVEFDLERHLWYCDIEFYNPFSYMPLVRMALARYQPHSIQGVELSRVVLADYAQLTPDRSAVVSIDPADTRRAQVFVGGIAPQAPLSSSIEVTIERRLANITSDLAWEVAPSSVVQVLENSPDATEPDAVLWSGSVVFVKAPAPGQYRIVVREFERIQIDGPPEKLSTGERLVYVAIVPYDYASS